MPHDDKDFCTTVETLRIKQRLDLAARILQALEQGVRIWIEVTQEPLTHVWIIE